MALMTAINTTQHLPNECELVTQTIITPIDTNAAVKNEINTPLPPGALARKHTNLTPTSPISDPAQTIPIPSLA